MPTYCGFRVPDKLGGVYVISVDFEMDSVGVGFHAAITVNDVPIAEGDASENDTLSLCVVRHLNDLDEVKAQVYKDSGSTVIAAEGGSGMVAAFNIARIYALNDTEVTEPPPCNPPVNTVAPAISPEPEFTAFDTLTSTDGTWTGDATITFTYQWQVQDEGIGSFVDIVGQTGATMDGVEVDGQDVVRLKVTATNDCDSTDAFSNSSEQVSE